MALAGSMCKSKKKEVIQVSSSRSMELLSGECCGFKKFRWVQVEVMFFPLSLCLCEHFNSDQKWVFEVNPLILPT